MISRTPSLLMAPSNSRIEGRNCCLSSFGSVLLGRVCSSTTFDDSESESEPLKVVDGLSKFISIESSISSDEKSDSNFGAGGVGATFSRLRGRIFRSDSPSEEEEEEDE